MRDSNAHAGCSLTARRRRSAAGVDARCRSSARRWRSCGSSTPKVNRGPARTIAAAGWAWEHAPRPDLFRRHVRARGGADRRARRASRRSGGAAARPARAWRAQRARRLRGGAGRRRPAFAIAEETATRRSSSRRSCCGRRSKARKAIAIDGRHELGDCKRAGPLGPRHEHPAHRCRLRLGRRPGSLSAGDRRGSRGRAGPRARRTGGVDALQPRGSALVARRLGGRDRDGPRRRRLRGGARFLAARCSSWFALRPIAVARGSVELLDRHIRASRRDKGWSLIRSTRGSSTAIHLAFADAGLEPAFVPEVELRLPCFDMDHGGPSWLAAVDAVVDTGSRRENSTASRRRSRGCECRSSGHRRRIWPLRPRQCSVPSCSPVAEPSPTRSRQPIGPRHPRSVVAREGFSAGRRARG